MNSMEVKMYENRGYNAFSHSWEVVATATGPAMVEDASGVERYWKKDDQWQALETGPSFMLTDQLLPPSAAIAVLSSLRMRRGLDSPAKPTLMREEPSSTTIVWWLVMGMRDERSNACAARRIEDLRIRCCCCGRWPWLLVVALLLVLKVVSSHLLYRTYLDCCHHIDNNDVVKIV